MTWARTLRAVLGFGILVVLHYTLRPLLGLRFEIDFLIIALLLTAVRVRPGMAAVLGFVIGLATDSLALAAFGAGALAMCAVGFTASWLKAVVFADNIALSGFFFFLGKWLFDILYLFIERRLRGAELVMQFLVWSPLSAAATAVAGILVIILLRPLLEPAPA